jgi:glycosyltransferase involved in cell wall biosynthesis
MKRNVFYFGLEPLKARYTYQLCNEWMPKTFEQYADRLNFIPIDGVFDADQEIKVGAVLDAIGRGKYSLTQCENFLKLIYEGQVKDNDIIFLQDYWTPGLDAIWYALDLYNIKVKVYAMLHAQSVDEYDFTYPMTNWMRHYELGLDQRMTGIFVGSSIHKEQLRAAGFKAPIHVVSLPIHKQATLDILPEWQSMQKKNVIVYSSRFDKEKNPFFMLEVAEKFLDANTNYEWHVTTSGKEFRSMLPGVIDAMNALAKHQPRFKMLSGLTKQEYYTELATCKVQFNTSLQDYVSWTVIESTAFGADIVFPNFRSFPEFIEASRLYKPFDVQDALLVLHNVLTDTKTHYDIVDRSDLGRQMEGYIVANDFNKEICIWHEAEYCKALIKQEIKNN